MSITESYIGIAFPLTDLLVSFIGIAMGFIALASTLISVADFYF